MKKTDTFEPVKLLLAHGSKVHIAGISALDGYFREPFGRFVEIETSSDIIELSTIFDSIEFPGEDRIDALVTAERGITCLIRSTEVGDQESRWKPLRFSYSPAERSFIDPYGTYQLLRKGGVLDSSQVLTHSISTDEWWYFVSDAAQLSARYGWEIDKSMLAEPDFSRPPAPLGVLEQQVILVRILESRYPAAGLNILMDCGFIHAHWNLLDLMNTVVQDKDFHPEGNVWSHTLEMFRHMKAPDFDIAWGILLHDCGKAFAQRQNQNEFDRHAQIGAMKGADFLRSLAMGREEVGRISFLVENHMLTAHIPEIPPHTIEEVLDDPLFPKLLEIYRCDISSTFRDPEGYYRACEFFRKYQRRKKNPYRNSRGKVARVNS